MERIGPETVEPETLKPETLGKEVGERRWEKARVKDILGEPPRRFRLVVPSLAGYIDKRINQIDRPDPLPPITGKEKHSGSVVWGRRTWDLPAGPDEARDVPSRYLDDREAAWIQVYHAVRAAVEVGLYDVGTVHARKLTDPIEIRENGEVMKEIGKDPVAVCSARPLDEDKDGRIPSYLADVVDATLYKIHGRAVRRQIQRARSMYKHARITPAIDRLTGEVLNPEQMRAKANISRPKTEQQNG
jgi:hypothetical protein